MHVFWLKENIYVIVNTCLRYNFIKHILVQFRVFAVGMDFKLKPGTLDINIYVSRYTPGTNDVIHLPLIENFFWITLDLIMQFNLFLRRLVHLQIICIFPTTEPER